MQTRHIGPPSMHDEGMMPEDGSGAVVAAMFAVVFLVGAVCGAALMWGMR